MYFVINKVDTLYLLQHVNLIDTFS